MEEKPSIGVGAGVTSVGVTVSESPSLLGILISSKLSPSVVLDVDEYPEVDGALSVSDSEEIVTASREGSCGLSGFKSSARGTSSCASSVGSLVSSNNLTSAGDVFPLADLIGDF